MFKKKKVEKKKENLPVEKAEKILAEVGKIQEIITEINEAEKDFVLIEKIALIRNRLIRTLEITKE